MWESCLGMKPLRMEALRRNDFSGGHFAGLASRESVCVFILPAITPL